MATNCTGNETWKDLAHDSELRRDNNDEAKRVRCNPDRLKFAMDQRGVDRGQLAALAGVNSRTIKGWFTSCRASRPHLEKVAEKLECSVGFLQGNEDTVVSRSNIRSIAGKWKISGADILDGGCAGQDENCGKIDGVLDIIQDEAAPTVIRARGHDQDGDLVELVGEIENNEFISGNYRVHNPRMVIFGTFFVHLVNDGRHIRGKYLGREKGRETTDNVVVGSLELVRIE